MRQGLLALLVLAATLTAPAAPAAADAVVVSGDSLATAVGLQVLAEGGNAVDAAVACALALAVTHPEAGNLGGGGYLVACDARGRAWGLDFRETAPAAYSDSTYRRLDAAGADEPSLWGATAGGIPGTPAGLWAAWQRGGSLPWPRLVEPARRLAAEGFPVSARLAANLVAKAEILRRYDSTRALYFPRGGPLRAGEVLVQPELAAVLAELAEKGGSAFYGGEIARRLVREVDAAGGSWTSADLADYRPRFVQPVVLPLDERCELLALPPTSSGAVVLGQTLYLLRASGALEAPPRSAERARGLVEALRLAFADRNQHLGDPASMELSWRALLDPAYLARRAALLPPPGRIGDSDAVGAGVPSPESDQTTHLCVFDPQGGCVSLTTTVNALFGSRWVVPGLGFFLNDEMDDFDTRPGEPNLYGLVGSGVNRVAGGRRPLSSMSPVIVRRDGAPWLALGGRGGPRILSGVLQVLLGRWWDGLPLQQAVDAPRLHHQWRPDRVDLEAGRLDPRRRRALRELGYGIFEVESNGKVHAAERGPDGRCVGAADPRDAGLAATLSPTAAPGQ